MPPTQTATHTPDLTSVNDLLLRTGEALRRLAFRRSSSSPSQDLESLHQKRDRLTTKLTAVERASPGQREQRMAELARAERELEEAWSQIRFRHLHRSSR